MCIRSFLELGCSLAVEPATARAGGVTTLRWAVQALRAQRAAELPSAKKRKRSLDDERASSADDMSDSDDAVGPPPLSR